MKTIPTVEGKFYCVATSTSCEVTTEAGTLLGTAEAGQPLWFQAQKGNTTTLSDDNAEYSASRFNSAPQQQLAVLGVLGGNDGLPAGYTRLAYLESTGEQVIDSGQKPLYDWSFYFEAQYTRVKNNTHVSIGLWRDDTISSLPTFGTWFVNVKAFYALKNKLEKNVASEDEILRKFSITYDGIQSVFTFNTKKIDLPIYENHIPPTNMGIFGGLRYYSYNYVRSCARIWTCSLRDENKVERLHFIPALDPTGAPCMFDTASKKPFYNSGSGAFIVGIEKQQQMDAVLRALPDRTGMEVGTLQVRLADDLQTPENEARLEAVLAKNWEISQAAQLQ